MLFYMPFSFTPSINSASISTMQGNSEAKSSATAIPIGGAALKTTFTNATLTSTASITLPIAKPADLPPKILISFKRTLSDAMPAAQLPSKEAPDRISHSMAKDWSLPTELGGIDPPLAVAVPNLSSPSAISDNVAKTITIKVSKGDGTAANDRTKITPDVAPAPAARIDLPFPIPLPVTQQFMPVGQRTIVGVPPSDGQAVLRRSGMMKQHDLETGYQTVIAAQGNSATAQGASTGDASSATTSFLPHMTGQSVADGQKRSLESPMPSPDSSALAGAATAGPVALSEAVPLPVTTLPTPVAAPAGQGAAVQIAAVMVGADAIPIAANQALSASGIRLTIAMAPPAIGMVTVQIDRHADGKAVIAVTATHPATLIALQNDHMALERALTQAGISMEHRSIAFHLDAARADTNPSSGQDTTGQNNGGQGNAGQLGMSSGQDGRRSRSEPSHGTAFACPSGDASGERPAAADNALPQRPIRMRRFGLNVMA